MRKRQSAGTVDIERVGVGESWAYRARAVDPLVEVVVLRHGTQRPPRVLVRFVDDEFEGRQEWVSPARLKGLWSHVDELRESEARWDRILALGLDRDDPREDAAEQVLELAVDEGYAEIGYRDGGALHIRDPEALAAAVGVEIEQLRGHPDAFTEDGMLIVPWPVTELVVRSAAQRNPGPILRHVVAEERKGQYEAIHGHYLAWGRGEDHYVTPEDSAEFDHEYRRPRRELLRSWCGAEAADRFDELVELRKEIRRVGQVAQDAIDALRTAGQTAQASQFQRELGTPVEMLRLDEPPAGS